MHLDEDLDVGAGRVADARDDRFGAPQIGGRKLGARGAEGIELERAIPALHDLAREPRNRRRLALRLIPAVRVRRHAIPEAAAEQLPHGDAERLPHQIPARDVERGERRLRHLARTPVLGPLNVPRETLDVERIGSGDVARCQLADARDERVGLVDHSHFRHAGQAAVGDQLDEDELAPRRADDGDADVDDFHGDSIP